MKYKEIRNQAVKSLSLHATWVFRLILLTLSIYLVALSITDLTIWYDAVTEYVPLGEWYPHTRQGQIMENVGYTLGYEIWPLLRAISPFALIAICAMLAPNFRRFILNIFLSTATVYYFIDNSWCPSCFGEFPGEHFSSGLLELVAAGLLISTIFLFLAPISDKLCFLLGYSRRIASSVFLLAASLFLHFLVIITKSITVNPVPMDFFAVLSSPTGDVLREGGFDELQPLPMEFLPSNSYPTVLYLDSHGPQSISWKRKEGVYDLFIHISRSCDPYSFDLTKKPNFQIPNVSRVELWSDAWEETKSFYSGWFDEFTLPPQQKR